MRALVLALGVAACGAKAREPVTHQVDIRAMQFVPARLEVAVGDTVVWTNSDILPHTVTSAGFDSQLMASKQQWRYRFTAAGEHGYVCTYHPTMRAVVIAR